MSQRVKNAVRQSDNLAGIPEGEGTRRVVFQGIEYVLGPNETRAFLDDTVAAAVGAGTNLRVADNRDSDGHSRR